MVGGVVYNVRFASLDDVKKLVKCYVEVWKSLGEWLPESVINPELDDLLKPETVERLKQQVEDANSIFLVAEEDGEIIGLAQGRVYTGVAQLGFLGVRKEFRGRGVGESLLHRFIEEARKRKTQKVWLYTSPTLLPAIKLYIKNGFIPEGYLRKHFHGSDLIIYSKFLSEEG
ncbi:MAG: GNAT family N-acetyltransferase [Candidatus Bathyarchaeia archaeon]